MTQLNAFVARSFAPQDDRRIQPVLEFLDTFRKVGFFWETAEPAEVESVSKKVRRMIDEKQVFIGFFSKRYPVYKFESKPGDAFKILLGNLQPQIWSAPAWVLQESGYALHGGKDLILLREPGVEVFGLQGDLEYIPFDSENLAEVFSKLNQMVHGLLEKAAGTEVRMVVTDRQGEKEAAIEQAVAEPSVDKPKQIDEEPDLISRFIEMQDAVEKQDFESLDQAWKAGSDLIAKGKSKEIDSMAWDCLYFEDRFEAGDANGLATLRRLRTEHPTRPEPVSAMARCMLNSGEQAVAAGLFLEAAQLQTNENFKARNLVSAAKAFRQTKQYEQGKDAIKQALSISTGETKEEAIAVLYHLLNDSKKKFFAFATAEAALHDNPLLPLRFSLGLDYRSADLDELGLSHFKFLNERSKNDSSSLHNLALMYSDCKLPITSVEHYKLAASRGETLSAANLGYMYLDGGMVKEARALLHEAMKTENHDPAVEKCLAEVSERDKEEKKKEVELLEKASTNKTFLVSMGQALMMVAPPIEGNWKFPFGEMPLTLSSNRIDGSADITSEISHLSALMGTPSGDKLTRTRRYKLVGTMTGSVCEFKLTVGDVTSGLLGGLATESKSGFIVFTADGKSATYAELSDGKLEKPEKLSKAA